MTSDCPMLQDLAFDAISSFSTGLKLSICKGGFHTGSFSYCGKLPFQLFLRGASKWLPCGPPPLSQLADHLRRIRQGMDRLNSSRGPSHCSEEECGTLSAEGQAGWGRTEMASSLQCPCSLEVSQRGRTV